MGISRIVGIIQIYLKGSGDFLIIKTIIPSVHFKVVYNAVFEFLVSLVLPFQIRKRWNLTAAPYRTRTFYYMMFGRKSVGLCSYKDISCDM
jgi:hypothetical protein